MIIVNCAVEKNIPIKAIIDSGANMNGISYKYISELGITYHSKNNSIEIPDVSYSTLGNVNLHIGFNDNEKYKIISNEFIILGSDWPGSDLILGML